MARRRLGLGPVRVDAASRAALSRYAWPGNVRELENVVFRSVLKAAAGVPRGDAVVVGLAHLGPEFGGVEGGGGASSPAASAAAAEPILPARIRTLREETDDFQRRLISRTAARHHGNWAAAARDLGLHRANLHRLVARLSIPRGR
jgi:anaerobic nitric oxide reductase transcription regulator